MGQRTAIQWFNSCLVYALGMFFLSLGVVISINARLGVSPVNSLPYVVSLITKTDFSVCVVAVYIVYILLEIVILRKDFAPVNLLQLITSTLFGYFVSFSKLIVGNFVIPTYLGQLTMLAISILLISLGMTLYLESKLIPMPSEGFILAVSQRTKKPYHNIKVATDCTIVTLGIALSLVFLGSLQGIREGTVVTAVLVGKVIALIRRPLAAAVGRFCFGVNGEAVTGEAADGERSHSHASQCSSGKQ